MKESELVVIRDFRQRVDAEMAQGALQARGVKSVISADDVGQQYVGIIGSVRLLVHEDQAELAQQILRASSN